MKPYHRNPRRITDKRQARLTETLARLGDLGGIVHNLETDEIIGGNQRMAVFKDGQPVVVEAYEEPDDQGTVGHGFIVWRGHRYAYRQVRWDAETAAEANIAANIGAGDWDWDILKEWNPGELQAYGFEADLLKSWQTDAEALGKMLAEGAQPAGEDPGPQVDKAAELREKWDTAAGQLWELDSGNGYPHRLICGDCTDRAVVSAVAFGGRMDLWLTDPPYGVSYADKNRYLNAVAKGNRIQVPIANDHLSLEDASAIWKAAAIAALEACADHASYYWFACQGGDQMMMMMMMLHEAGWRVRHELIWVKNNHVLGRTDYNYKHEPILYGWKKDGKHKFFGGFQTSVLEFPKPQQSNLHPTTKPVDLIERLITNSTEAGQIVLDSFLGSGTTLIACEKLGRRARCIEIEPAYVAVALERWSILTGKTPALIASSPPDNAPDNASSPPDTA